MIKEVISNLALIILAGGRGTRIGEVNKALLPIGKETMLTRIINNLSPLFDEIIVVVKESEPFIQYPVRVILDEYPGCGPISGIHSGLKASADQYNLVLACDLPMIKIELVSFLLKNAKQDVTIPQVGEYLEPLVAVYAKRILPLVEEFIEADNFKVINLLRKLELEIIPESTVRQFDPDLRSFVNVNSPVEYKKVLKIFERENK